MMPEVVVLSGFGQVTMQPRIYTAQELVPRAWHAGRLGSDRDWRVYNPAIVRYRDRLMMTYRVDSGYRKTMQRRIGLCELDDDLHVIPGSVMPLSDTIQGGDPYRYDPRFLVYNDRLFIHYNNNFRTRPNHIYLVELDADTLEAVTPARPLHYQGSRQEIEKNWMFFDHDGDLYAVYTIAPHVVLHVDLTGRGTVNCEPVFRWDWDVALYADRYGEPRGGAPPVRHGELYVSFFHSRYPASCLHRFLRYWPIAAGTRLPRILAAMEWRLRRPFAQVRYVAGVYTFEAAPPFRPKAIYPQPVLCPQGENPRKALNRTNPFAHGVVYPCGAVRLDTELWLLSYGLHDEYCCLQAITSKYPGTNIDSGGGKEVW